MTIDVYTSAGVKKGTAELPTALFEAPIRQGLMHQLLVMQQSNRRMPIAHVKSRGEVQGSTRKLYAQKGTGRARRGSVRSPLLRGGGKAFGPRNVANFRKEMPKKMRRQALFSCLSLQAKHGAILGLESYPTAVKTKDAFALLKKLPVELGRHILFVLPEKHDGLTLSVRNVPRVKTVLAAFLNPEDVLKAKKIIFLVDALKKAEEVFGKKEKKETEEIEVIKEKATKAKAKKAPAKKVAAKKPSSKK